MVAQVSVLPTLLDSSLSTKFWVQKTKAAYFPAFNHTKTSRIQIKNKKKRQKQKLYVSTFALLFSFFYFLGGARDIWLSLIGGLTLVVASLASVVDNDIQCKSPCKQDILLHRQHLHL
jgi:hypothetical protein